MDVLVMIVIIRLVLILRLPLKHIKFVGLSTLVLLLLRDLVKNAELLVILVRFDERWHVRNISKLNSASGLVIERFLIVCKFRRHF